MQLPAKRKPKRVTVAVATIALAVLVARWGVVQGLIFPVRVAGDSMGRTLPGAHWRVPCADCGFAIVCGTQHPPADNGVVCPNCGYAGNRLDAGKQHRGRRVLIDKLSLRFRTPRRWEVVALRDPQRPQRLLVKRVVGLPGERITLDRGDVLVDGAVVRKALAQLRAVAVPVYDDAHRAPKLADRWQPIAAAAAWHRKGPAIDFQPNGRTSTPVDRFEWITYQHRSCLPPPAVRDDAGPATDADGFNQGLSRQLNAVTDLLLRFDALLDADAELAVRIHDGYRWFTVRWSPAAGTVRLRRDDQVVAREQASPVSGDRPVVVELAACDRQILLAIDGRTVLAHRYEWADAPPQPIDQPLQIGACGGNVRIERLRIDRDLHFAGPGPAGWAWSTDAPLAEGRFLLLGDNVPVSRDGRFWPAGVPRAWLRGRICPQGAPPREPPTGGDS